MLSGRFRRVAIMGAGTMGSDFALIFASADFDV
ncbi:MAG: 3-hydroxyacyl-CoA dehydrogenase NAD-binding domain-containing protein, partial [Candidatus Freyarchaeota archaeon]